MSKGNTRKVLQLNKHGFKVFAMNLTAGIWTL